MNRLSNFDHPSNSYIPTRIRTSWLQYEGVVDGGERAFNLDVARFDLPAAQAELAAVELYLFHAPRPDFHGRQWLRRRMFALHKRLQELKQGQANDSR